MQVLRKVVVSVLAGALFYGVLLSAVLKYRPSTAAANLVLWNVTACNMLSNGAPDDDSAPIYDGKGGFPGATWPGLLSGLLIYPVVFFALFTLRGRAGK